MAKKPFRSGCNKLNNFKSSQNNVKSWSLYLKRKKKKGNSQQHTALIIIYDLCYKSSLFIMSSSKVSILPSLLFLNIHSSFCHKTFMHIAVILLHYLNFFYLAINSKLTSNNTNIALLLLNTTFFSARLTHRVLVSCVHLLEPGE